MRTAWAIVLLCAGALHAEDFAVLTQPKPGVAFIQVEIGASVPSGQRPVAVLMKTTDDGSEAVATSVEQLESGSGLTRFTLPLTAPDPKAAYYVVIAPITVGDTPRVLEVALQLRVSLRLSPLCKDGLHVSLRTARALDVGSWQQIAAWLRGPNPSAVATVRVHPAGKTDREIPVKRVETGTQSPEQMATDMGASVCLVLADPLPVGSFRTTVAFHAAPRGELAAPLVNAAMQRSALSSPESGGSADAPGSRSLERNLDAAVTLTSDVRPADPSSSVPCTNRGSRCTTGVFDIRLAPWLNILGRNLDVKKWIGLYTPFYVDATVSTARIDTDTLSQNRIVLGTEYELRRYSSTASGSSFHRVILRGSHASDRDFKQKEYSASAEYKPIVGRLSQPIQWTWSTDRLVKDSEGHSVRVYRQFGWDIQPAAGVELGHTYSRRNPAAAVLPSPAARRLYWGGTAAAGLTRHLTISGTGTAYVRGEAPDDRLHQYLKVEADIPFWLVAGKAANLFFVSYERGGKPPFDKPDVNALVIGYKIQAQGWFGQQR